MATPTLEELDRAFDEIIAKYPTEATAVELDKLVWVLENVVGVPSGLALDELMEGLEVYQNSITPKYEIGRTDGGALILSLRGADSGTSKEPEISAGAKDPRLAGGNGGATGRAGR